MSSLNLFTRPNLNRNAISTLDAFSWYLFLGHIVIVSFLFSGFASKSWMAFSASFYFWMFFQMLVLSCGGQFNARAIKAASVVIALLILSIIWLSLSLTMELDHALYRIFNENLAMSPDWFDPIRNWSVTKNKTYWLLTSEMLFLFMFLSTLALVDRRSRLRQMLIVIAIVGLAHALIAMVGKVAGIIFVDAEQVDGHFSAARGLFINRNHFGAFISLTFIGGLAFQIKVLSANKLNSFKNALVEQLSDGRILLAFYVLTTLIAIIGSESRGALLSLLASILIVGVFSASSFEVFKRPFFIFILFSLVLILTYFGQDLIVRFMTDKLSLGERYQQWSVTWEAIRLNPWFGYGGGSYGTVFQIFRGEEGFRQVFYAQSHNHFLHLWVERGLIGLGFWLIVLVLVIRHAFKMSSRVKSKLVASTLVAAHIVIIAAIIQSLVDFNLQMLNIRAYFMVILALVFAAPRVSLRR